MVGLPAEHSLCLSWLSLGNIRAITLMICCDSAIGNYYINQITSAFKYAFICHDNLPSNKYFWNLTNKRFCHFLASNIRNAMQGQTHEDMVVAGEVILQSIVY